MKFSVKLLYFQWNYRKLMTCDFVRIESLQWRPSQLSIFIISTLQINTAAIHKCLLFESNGAYMGHVQAFPWGCIQILRQKMNDSVCSWQVLKHLRMTPVQVHVRFLRIVSRNKWGIEGRRESLYIDKLCANMFAF